MISKTAIWSGRFAAFAAQLAILGILLHRFEVMSTPVALNLLLTCFGLAAMAILVGIIAYAVIWRTGGLGFGRASFGIFLGGLILVWPSFYVPKYVVLPIINDVTTDTVNPPRFTSARKARMVDANPAAYPGGDFAKLQKLSYPDIKPLVVKYSRVQALDTVRMMMKKREWTILGEDRPAKGKRVGKIEAVDRTTVLGFTDDIVVRVGGKDGKAKIDVRSASRYGRHDFGRNAERIRGFLKELHARLDVGEALTDKNSASTVLLTPPGKKKRVRKRVHRKRYVRKRRASRRARKRRVWRRLRRQRRYRYKPFPVY